MVSKLISCFLAACLAVVPIVAVSAPGVVSQGQFDDGVEGKVKMLLVTQQGKKYMAELSCGTSI